MTTLHIGAILIALLVACISLSIIADAVAKAVNVLGGPNA